MFSISGTAQQAEFEPRSRLKIGLRKLANSILRLVAGLFVKKIRNQEEFIANFRPKRILLLNGSHIGDIVISTSIIPILRSAYPDAELGFITGSWSSMVLSGHPDIKYLHCVDHWRINRDQISFYKKLLQYWKTRKKALMEIRQTGYDISLSLYCWYPDFMFFSWQAGIPIRVGFKQNVFAPFATLLADSPLNSFLPQGARQAEILSPLSIGEEHFAKRKSVLPPSSDEAIKEVCRLFQTPKLEGKIYRIIHMGSGAPHRELSTDFWRQIALELSKTHILLFTGKGKREADRIATVIDGLQNCIDACDHLSWSGFVAAIRYAEVLYGVESMAGHAAAAVGTKCILAYTGASGVARWRPESDQCLIFTNHVLCAPCYKVTGCNEMNCLRSIKPTDILNADF